MVANTKKQYFINIECLKYYTLIPILSLIKLEVKIMGQTGKYIELKSIYCAVITISDTRMEETDKSGNLIIKSTNSSKSSSCQCMKLFLMINHSYKLH